jgi:tRNA threonylcarbamoyladenosine biosynthesis protein TsaE
VIELISDLGGGKTTFVQGLTVALGYTGEVTSPTFALSNIYRLPRDFDLHHYDLYRLSYGGVVGEDMAEDMGAPDVVIVIEWAGAVQEGLPADRLHVTLEHMGEDVRRLAFEAGGPNSERLVRGLADGAAPTEAAL